MTNIITFVLILFSTLIVVIVLFKFLRSEASKTDKGYKLKGAAAGFVVILGFVMAAFTQIYKSIPLEEHEKILNNWKLVKWTVSAAIEKEDEPSFEGVTAVYDPPEPSIQINRYTRRITLSDVLICPERGYPTIIFHCKGYLPVPVEIDEEKDIFEIDKIKHTIKIKAPIKLEKIER